MINERESSLNEVSKEYESREDFEKEKDKEILGKGASNKVILIPYKKEIFAVKLIEKEKFDESEYIKVLIGPHIIEINKFCSSKNKLGKNYNSIIMENAKFKELSKLILFFHERNLLNLINPNCFDEECSDTLLRYFARYIIDGMMDL